MSTGSSSRPQAKPVEIEGQIWCREPGPGEQVRQPLGPPPGRAGKRLPETTPLANRGWGEGREGKARLGILLGMEQDPTARRDRRLLVDPCLITGRQALVAR